MQTLGSNVLPQEAQYYQMLWQQSGAGPQGLPPLTARAFFIHTLLGEARVERIAMINSDRTSFETYS